ncbi:MAG: hypothetical protein ABSF26_09000 [Thermoguttaceae bacterium]|jgi:hypothetical protein
MIRFSFFSRRYDKARAARQRHTRRPVRCGLATGLSLEQLEDRRLLTIIVPGTFADTNAPFAPVSVGPTAVYNPPHLTLRDAVIEANYLFGTVNPGVANTILLLSGTYMLSIANTAGHEALSKTGDLNINSSLTIQGAATSGGPKTTIQQKAADRVFDVNATGLIVNFNNLTISGGTAVDDAVAGHLPGAYPAEGGGLWASGDTLGLSNVTFKGDRALGGAGTATSVSQLAEGGAIWVSGGTLGLTGVTFQDNSALGGAGFNGTATAPNGGAGNNGYGGGLYATGSVTVAGVVSPAGSANFIGNKVVGGNGGNGANGASTGGGGGPGGFGFGGGLYDDSSTITLRGGSMSSNLAQGGAGGKGGNGATLGGDGGYGGEAGAAAAWFSGIDTVSLTEVNMSANTSQSGDGGAGGAGTGASGHGGTGGTALGGGDAVVFEGNTLILTSDVIDSNLALGGNGAAGGAGGAAGNGGLGGTGGSIYGTAVYQFGGTVTVTNGSMSANRALGGNGGVGGKAGSGGQGGSGGYAEGGALWAYGGTLTVTGTSMDLNLAQAGNGAKGGNSSAASATGGKGGQGGGAQGGGVYLFDITSAMIDTPDLSGNKAIGGNGASGGTGHTLGNAGNGGEADGGGLYTYGGTTTVSSSQIEMNTAQGGNGGHTGATGTGLGGNGVGGGACIDGSGTLKLTNYTVVDHNSAIAGLGFLGGTPATASFGGVDLFSGTLDEDATVQVFDNSP